MPDAKVVEWIREKYEAFVEDLDERGRRRWAAAEARSLVRGRIAAVAEATGISDRTIRNGILELDSSHQLGSDRQRRPGAGRLSRESQQPELIEALELLVGGQLNLTLIDDFLPTVTDIFTVLGAGDLQGVFGNVTNGQRLSTSDGLGSFLVHYGADSAFDPNAVVLSNFLADGLLANFDGDGDVDGRDFLIWQRNPAVGSLTDWQANYGLPLTAASTAVPEPGEFALIAMISITFAVRRCEKCSVLLHR